MLLTNGTEGQNSTGAVKASLTTVLRKFFEGLSNVPFYIDKAPYVLTGYTLLLASAMVLGIIGNVLIVYVLLGRWCTRSSFTYYTSGQAMYQLLKCVLLLPCIIFTRGYVDVVVTEEVGNFLCKGYRASLVFFTVNTSLVTLIAAWDRLGQLSRPWRITYLSHVLIKFIAIGLFSLVSTAPAFTLYSYQDHSDSGGAVFKVADNQVYHRLRLRPCSLSNNSQDTVPPMIFAVTFSAIYYTCVVGVAIIYCMVCYKSTFRHQITAATRKVSSTTASTLLPRSAYDPTSSCLSKDHALPRLESVGSSPEGSVTIGGLTKEEDKHRQKYLKSTSFHYMTLNLDCPMIDSTAFSFENMRTGNETDQEVYEHVMKNKVYRCRETKAGPVKAKGNGSSSRKQSSRHTSKKKTSTASTKSIPSKRSSVGSARESATTDTKRLSRAPIMNILKPTDTYNVSKSAVDNPFVITLSASSDGQTVSASAPVVSPLSPVPSDLSLDSQSIANAQDFTRSVTDTLYFMPGNDASFLHGTEQDEMTVYAPTEEPVAHKKTSERRESNLPSLVQLAFHDSPEANKFNVWSRNAAAPQSDSLIMPFDSSAVVEAPKASLLPRLFYKREKKHSRSNEKCEQKEGHQTTDKLDQNRTKNVSDSRSPEVTTNQRVGIHTHASAVNKQQIKPLSVPLGADTSQRVCIHESVGAKPRVNLPPVHRASVTQRMKKPISDLFGKPDTKVQAAAAEVGQSSKLLTKHTSTPNNISQSNIHKLPSGANISQDSKQFQDGAEGRPSGSHEKRGPKISVTRQFQQSVSSPLGRSKNDEDSTTAGARGSTLPTEQMHTPHNIPQIKSFAVRADMFQDSRQFQDSTDGNSGASPVKLVQKSSLIQRMRQSFFVVLCTTNRTEEPTTTGAKRRTLPTEGMDIPSNIPQSKALTAPPGASISEDQRQGHDNVEDKLRESVNLTQKTSPTQQYVQSLYSLVVGKVEAAQDFATAQAGQDDCTSSNEASSNGPSSTGAQSDENTADRKFTDTQPGPKLLNVTTHSSESFFDPSHAEKSRSQRPHSLAFQSFRHRRHSEKDEKAQELSSHYGSTHNKHLSDLGKINEQDMKNKVKMSIPSSFPVSRIGVSGKRANNNESARVLDKVAHKDLFRSYNQESRGIIPYPRTVIVFILLLLTLVISYIPVMLLTLSEVFHWDFSIDKVVFLRIIELFFFTHDVANPVIWGLLNLSFRNEITDLLGFGFRVGSVSKSTSVHDSGQSIILD